MPLIARRMPAHLLGCFERDKLYYYYQLIYLVSVFCSFIIMPFSNKNVHLNTIPVIDFVREVVRVLRETKQTEIWECPPWFNC